MTKLILSTGNIVSGGPSIIRKPGAYRSNLELTNSLRSNFLAAQQASTADDEDEGTADYDSENGFDGETLVNGNGHSAHPNGSQRRPPLAAWTQREGSVLYVPRLDASADEHGLQEEQAQYETTVKLFFLSSAAAETRAQYMDDALALVFRELGVDSIDLLVLSFPGKGDCSDGVDSNNSNSNGDDDNNDDRPEEVAATWAAAEALHTSGRVRRLGVAEFGSKKLAQLLAQPTVRVKPAVDQINLRNCCNVPPALAVLAKEQRIDLLVHTDCTDVLPPGTLRELLGQGLQGAGVLVDGTGKTDTETDALRGDLTPEWVVKYTAVVRDRGVIENKGYFAAAELHDA